MIIILNQPIPTFDHFHHVGLKERIRDQLSKICMVLILMGEVD